MHREEKNYCPSFIQWREGKHLKTQQENKISMLPLAIHHSTGPHASDARG